MEWLLNTIAPDYSVRILQWARHVRQSLVAVRQLLVSEPKTRRGDRSVQLDAETVRS
jgi:hypothetical protein